MRIFDIESNKQPYLSGEVRTKIGNTTVSDMENWYCNKVMRLIEALGETKATATKKKEESEEGFIVADDEFITVDSPQPAQLTDTDSSNQLTADKLTVKTTVLSNLLCQENQRWATLLVNT